MVRPQNTQLVGNHILVQGNSVGQTPRRAAGACEAAPGGKGVGMVRPQNTQLVGNHLLVQGNRLVNTARHQADTC